VETLGYPEQAKLSNVNTGDIGIMELRTREQAMASNVEMRDDIDPLSIFPELEGRTDDEMEEIFLEGMKNLRPDELDVLEKYEVSTSIIHDDVHIHSIEKAGKGWMVSVPHGVMRTDIDSRHARIMLYSFAMRRFRPDESREFYVDWVERIVRHELGHLAGHTHEEMAPQGY